MQTNNKVLKKTLFGIFVVVELFVTIVEVNIPPPLQMMNQEHVGEMGQMPHYLPTSLARAAQRAGVTPISSGDNMAAEAADEATIQVGGAGSTLSSLYFPLFSENILQEGSQIVDTVQDRTFSQIYFRGLPKIPFRGHDIFADWDLKVGNLLYFLSK